MNEDYVLAAFAVVWFVLLVYVALVGLRTSRIAREVELLTRLAERRQPEGEGAGAGDG